MHGIANTLPRFPRLAIGLSQGKNFWLILGGDILLVAIVHFLAYCIRFEGNVDREMERMAATLPMLLLIKIPVFFAFGLYRGMWRYTSIADLFGIAKAVVVSSAVVILAVLYLNRFGGFSRAIFLLDGVLTFLALGAHRLAIRLALQYWENRVGSGATQAPQSTKRLLLVGAGSAAERVLREIAANSGLPYRVVGLLDDDAAKHGLKIHGIAVLGSVDHLAHWAARTRADEVLISVATATPEQMRRLVDLARAAKTPFKVLPSLGEIIKGRLTISAMRDISYNDLLGRPAVDLDQEEIGKYLTGRVVLVTGAGGSIGSELCRQIIGFDPKTLILLDAGEENLYKIQMELHHEHRFHDYVPVLGKIQNRALLDSLFCQYAPSVVFHAAAYKHVPLIEANPWEAIFNNVFAVRNLIETAIYHRAKKFVVVSTDKAVRPTNVMGASKRLTELLMLAYCRELWDKNSDRGACRGLRAECNGAVKACPVCGGHDTTFMAVRFGNVLGSSGSVIPLFKKQIEKGGPVTVTHPEMTRYFMSIPEAAQLILQAGAMGRGGEIFLLKMGNPVRIADLARDLIKLLGREPDTEIKITYTGLRPGEKLYEELITSGEGIVATGHEKIMVLRGDGRPYREMEAALSELAQKAKSHDAQAIKGILQRLIPEYAPDREAASTINDHHYIAPGLRN